MVVFVHKLVYAVCVSEEILATLALQMMYSVYCQVASNRPALLPILKLAYNYSKT